MKLNKTSHLLPRIIFLLALPVLGSVASAQDLKVYISADMEGVAGAVAGAQMGPSGFEYGQFRKYMTAEVNAAISAAREAGATEILVSDSHGNGMNLLMDELPQDIELIRSWPRPLGMMEGIDESFDAAMFIGYHASIGNVDGIAAHTLSGDLTSVKINGREMTEGSMNALIAGYFDVPVVMVSGDEAAVREISDLVGPIEGAIVKWHNSHSAGRTLMPAAAQALIGEKARAGLSRLDELKPYRLGDRLTLDMSYKNDEAAELMAYLPNVDRVDNHTIRFVGNIIEIVMFTEMALGYPATMN
jgi:D-amino peptidase